MFTAHDPTHNRLLALEQELLGRQHSHPVSSEELPTPSDSKMDWMEVWTTDTAEEQEEDWEHDEWQEPEWHQENTEIVFQQSWEDQGSEAEWEDQAALFCSEPSSYVALAEMLHRSSSQRFRGNVLQLQAKWEPPASAEATGIAARAFEPPAHHAVSSPETLRSTTSDSIDILSDIPADILNDNPVTPTPSERSLAMDAAIDLPMTLPTDDPARSLSEKSRVSAELPDAFPDSSSIFSDGASSYTSLASMLQSARHPDRSSPHHFETEIDAMTAVQDGFSSQSPVQTTRTIDIKAWSVPESELPEPEIPELKTTSPYASLPSTPAPKQLESSTPHKQNYPRLPAAQPTNTSALASTPDSPEAAGEWNPPTHAPPQIKTD